jgi:hypothetical protein
MRVFQQYGFVPKVLAKFEALNYPLINLSCQFFLSLFTICLPERESLKVLDLFFLEGMQSSKLIFDVTLAYLRCLEPQIVQCESFQTLVQPDNATFNDPNLLMQEIRRARTELKQEHIDFYRNVCHAEVLDEMHKQRFNKFTAEKSRKVTLQQRQKEFIK